MENQPEIYQSLARVMLAVGAIGKEKFNRQQGFNYRGIDDAYNALHPLFRDEGIISVPEVLEVTREERTSKSGGNLIYSIAKVKYTFFAKDGSSVSSIVVGEGMDSADKSMNKAMAVAHKYALMQMFCIPTEDMPDPDADTPDPLPPKRPSSADKPKGLVTPKKIEQIKAAMEKLNLTTAESRLERLNGWLAKSKVREVSSMEELTMNQADNLLRALSKSANGENRHAE